MMIRFQAPKNSSGGSDLLPKGYADVRISLVPGLRCLRSVTESARAYSCYARTIGYDSNAILAQRGPDSSPPTGSFWLLTASGFSAVWVEQKTLRGVFCCTACRCLAVPPKETLDRGHRCATATPFLRQRVHPDRGLQPPKPHRT